MMALDSLITFSVLSYGDHFRLISSASMAFGYAVGSYFLVPYLFFHLEIIYDKLCMLHNDTLLLEDWKPLFFLLSPVL